MPGSPRAPLPCLIAGALALIAVPGAAQQDRRSVTCGASGNVVTAMVCSDTTIGASDSRIVGHVDTVIERLEAQSEEDPEALADFQASQEDWVAARDNCRRSTDPRGCIAEAYATREAELVATFELEEPAESASYSCPGQPAGSMAISFFDLDLPAVRIESGGEPVTGTATRTVDGAKYTLSSGQQVWVRKDVARFTDADGTTVTCVIEGR